MGKKKIAVFIRGFHNGGIEKVFENYFSNMDLSLFEIHMITHMNNDPIKKQVFTDMGCIIHELSPIKGSKINKTNLTEYRLLFKENRFDIVHNNMPEVILPLLYAKKNCVPIRILHAHSDYMRRISRLKSLLYKQVFQINTSYATALICISEDSARSAFFRMKSKAILLPNAIDTSKYCFDDKKRDFVRDLLELKDCFVIGHVGRFESEVKNHQFILDLFRKYYEVHREARLLLVGEGKLREKYMKVADDYGLSDRVIFTGAINCVSDYLMAMDCFVFPSKQEGLGISAIEAQATGLACLISDQVPEEVKITDKVVFLPIYGNKAEQCWMDEIQRQKNTDVDRSSYAEIVRQAGYDIKDCAGVLYNIYSQ